MSLEKFYIIIIEVQWSLIAACGCDLCNFYFCKNSGSEKSSTRKGLVVESHETLYSPEFLSIDSMHAEWIINGGK